MLVYPDSSFSFYWGLCFQQKSRIALQWLWISEWQRKWCCKGCVGGEARSTSVTLPSICNVTYCYSINSESKAGSFLFIFRARDLKLNAKSLIWVPFSAKAKFSPCGPLAMQKSTKDYSLQVRSLHCFYLLWFCSTYIWKAAKALKNCQGITEPQRL